MSYLLLLLSSRAFKFKSQCVCLTPLASCIYNLVFFIEGGSSN